MLTNKADAERKQRESLSPDKTVQISMNDAAAHKKAMKVSLS
jgi:hypothetical protein